MGVAGLTRDRELAVVDHELVEYRKALALVSTRGRVTVWEQIDRLLERRYVLQVRTPEGVNVPPQ